MKQSLDYTDPTAAANFRDVGEFINLISGKDILPEGRLFRGGTIKEIRDAKVIGNSKTIFCLQKSADHSIEGVRNVHFPISNDYEKYCTSLPEVRTWLRSIVHTIEEGIEFPLYVHCLSGRDRTGVVVAALLKICGAQTEHIVEEYKLSTGTETRNDIQESLRGIAIPENYFYGINLEKVKNFLQGKNE